jgi:hypothetical protein
MTSEKLLRSDGSLNPSLSIGKDFELVGSLVRWYIERVYGVLDVIISGGKLTLHIIKKNTSSHTYYS